MNVVPQFKWVSILLQHEHHGKISLVECSSYMWPWSVYVTDHHHWQRCVAVTRPGLYPSLSTPSVATPSVTPVFYGLHRFLLKQGLWPSGGYCVAGEETGSVVFEVEREGLLVWKDQWMLTSLSMILCRHFVIESESIQNNTKTSDLPIVITVFTVCEYHH